MVMWRGQKTEQDYAQSCARGKIDFSQSCTNYYSTDKSCRRLYKDLGKNANLINSIIYILGCFFSSSCSFVFLSGNFISEKVDKENKGGGVISPLSLLKCVL